MLMRIILIFPNVSRFADMYSDIDGYGKTGYMIENKLDRVESAGATTYDAFLLC
mgnify:CR=1 FL=1